MSEGYRSEDEEEAAREAGAIGGPDPDPDVDPAERARRESGEGESEGFEIAEEDLERNASHDDGKGNPLLDRFDEQEGTTADQDVYGEADEEEVQE